MHRYNRGGIQALMDLDPGYEPSNESEASPHTLPLRGHRSVWHPKGDRGGPRKHHVMLNIKGKEVLASYWEP